MRPVQPALVYNRVKEALHLYVQNEAQHIAANPAGWKNDIAGYELKYQWYSEVARAYSSGFGRKNKLNPAEKQSLNYVRSELKRMRAVINPTTLNRFYNHPVVYAIRSFLGGNNRNFNQHTRDLQQVTRAQLKHLNLEVLRQSMQQVGFSEAMDTSLQKMMEQGFDQFHLRYSDVKCKNTSFVLYFEKVPGSNYYYFQSFTATATPELGDLFTQPNNAVSQNFPLHQGGKFTATQAAVLVNNGHVCIPLENKEQWVGLDRTQIRPDNGIPLVKYSFDLPKALNRLPLKPLSQDQFMKLADSLKQGVSRVVDLMIDNKAVKCIIKAAPHIGQMLIYDRNHLPLNWGRNAKAVGAAMKQQETTLRLIDEPVLGQDKTRKIR
ncbi:hypothetical protein [Chitinophaga varians]|uniref:hypothetical protein n=1 Tax=Chitinophaga varians TaxID=2202339 RepID=UPI00165FC600|nr:hypothetical protein [Chitinophaga varians]MBC9909125.1 hypothetical protein [Chitinophaga varians]